MIFFFMYVMDHFQEELDALKARLVKVEKEKNEYKVAAEKYESRVRSLISRKSIFTRWR